MLPEAAGQREHSLREVFNAWRCVARSVAPRRLIPHDLLPWAAVYKQARRWFAAGCFEAAAASTLGRGAFVRLDGRDRLLAGDYETLEGLSYVAVSILMLHNAAHHL